MAILKIKPVGDRLLVKKILPSKKMLAGMVELADEKKKEFVFQGKIIAVGDEIDAKTFKLGSIIIFVWGDEVAENEFIINQLDVLALCQ